MTRIDRTADRIAVTNLLECNPVVAILGARQVGKSTLTEKIRAVALRRVLEDLAPLR